MHGASPRSLVALPRLALLLSGCAGLSAARTEVDASLPFDLSAGEPWIWDYYAYPYDQLPRSYELGWNELHGCLDSAEPRLPMPDRTFDILGLAQAMATSIAWAEPETTTIGDLLRARVVPGTLRTAGPVRASYYLGVLLRCAEQGRLIVRIVSEKTTNDATTNPITTLR